MKSGCLFPCPHCWFAKGGLNSSTDVSHFYLSVKSVSLSVISDSLKLHGLSPPGSSDHRILQARILEWVAIPFSRGIFLNQGLNPGLHTADEFFYHLSHQESPNSSRKFFWDSLSMILLLLPECMWDGVRSGWRTWGKSWLCARELSTVFYYFYYFLRGLHSSASQPCSAACFLLGDRILPTPLQIVPY